MSPLLPEIVLKVSLAFVVAVAFVVLVLRTAARLRGPARLGWVALNAAALALAVLVSAGFLDRIHVPLAATVGVLLPANLLVAFRWRAPLERAFDRLAARRHAAAATVAASIVIFLGAAELGARFLHAFLWDSYVNATVTVTLGQETADFRRHHIMGDEYREFDPETLWVPRPIPPYNRWRVKAADDFRPGKPPGTLRILVLGDSNVDGLFRQAWPHRLEDRANDLMERLAAAHGLAMPHIEVVNAGVVGYTSFQGMRRLESLLALDPDIVVAAFGWNDCATTRGPQDAEYLRARWVSTHVQRFLMRYRSYLFTRYVLGALKRGLFPEPPDAPERPRVPLDAFLANHAAMRDMAEAHGARFVVVTRPFNPAFYPDAKPPGWRATVLPYRDALEPWCHAQRVPFLNGYGETVDHPELFADECHYTEEGHDFLAKRMLDLLLYHRMLPGGELVLERLAPHGAPGHNETGRDD